MHGHTKNSGKFSALPGRECSGEKQLQKSNEKRTECLVFWGEVISLYSAFLLQYRLLYQGLNPLPFKKSILILIIIC